MPLAASAAIAAAAEKHRKYGNYNALPRTMPPFVAIVEHACDINKGWMDFFRRCRKKALNKLHVREAEASMATWSSRAQPGSKTLKL